MPNLRVNNRDRWIWEGVRVKTIDAGYGDVFKRDDETSIEYYIVLMGLIQYKLLQNGYHYDDKNELRDYLVIDECVNFIGNVMGKGKVLKFQSKMEKEELLKWVDGEEGNEAKIFTWYYKQYAKLLEEE